jgi:hypothetical protein
MPCSETALRDGGRPGHMVGRACYASLAKEGAVWRL